MPSLVLLGCLRAMKMEGCGCGFLEVALGKFDGSGTVELSEFCVVFDLRVRA